MEERIKSFVKERLNGRYTLWITDQCLVSLLVAMIHKCESIFLAGMTVFETILEHDCGVAINGYEVAKDFEKWMMNPPGLN